VAALRVEQDGDVLRVTLAKPERRNAFDAALINELYEAFADVGDARVVVLAGEGPSFCAGADVEWQRSAVDLSFDKNVEDALRLYGMLVRVDGCPAPLVARVQGHALGGGSGLVACADVVVAAPDASFGFTEVRLGIIHVVAEQLDEEVERVVGELLKSGPRATRAAKRLVREFPFDGEELARMAAGLRAGEEGQEGLRAFLERRPPSWQS
jgi:methylglutaconyl-CoA hydratase